MDQCGVINYHALSKKAVNDRFFTQTYIDNCTLPDIAKLLA